MKGTVPLVLVASFAIAHAAPGSVATMKAAIEKGDVDEASRQGVLAGPAIVEAALASSDRATVLAGIAAASHVEDRAELLEPLSVLARGPDRRTAIPAARAAAQIARELSQHEPADDVADADIVAWRDRYAAIAADRTRWVEVRILAIDAAGYAERSRGLTQWIPAPGLGAPALDLRGDIVGVPWTIMFADPDPAIRRAVLANVPSPTPAPMRDLLAEVIISDTDARVALAAAAALCSDLAFDPAEPILSALTPAGITRVQTIVTTDGASRGHLRAAARCLSADKSPASTAALRKIRNLR